VKALLGWMVLAKGLAVRELELLDMKFWRDIVGLCWLHTPPEYQQA